MTLHCKDVPNKLVTLNILYLQYMTPQREKMLTAIFSKGHLLSFIGYSSVLTALTTCCTTCDVVSNC